MQRKGLLMEGKICTHNTVCLELVLETLLVDGSAKDDQKDMEEPGPALEQIVDYMEQQLMTFYKKQTKERFCGKKKKK